jgi:hypothetical protein
MDDIIAQTFDLKGQLFGLACARLRASIARPWANELVNLILLDDMADPAGNAPERKKEQRRAGWQTQDAPRGDQAKVQTRRKVDLCLYAVARSSHHAGRGRIRRGSKREFCQVVAAWVAIGIEKMAETRERIASAQAIGHSLRPIPSNFA